MRVLLLIDGMDIGGAETHLLTLAQALKESGTDVSVLCAGGVYTEALRASGIPVYLAPLKERSLSGVLRSVRALRRMRKMDFHALHAHTRYTAALANFCLPKIPLVTTVHLDFSLTPAKRVLACWGRKCLAVSEDLTDYVVREYGVKESDVLPTVNGIDPRRFSPLFTRGRHILHVSRLDKDRSRTALLLCELAPRLARLAPEREIRILGTGDDLARVTEAAERANRQIGRETVRLYGACDNVAQALRDGALLVGVSRAALEAAARGLPVILAGNDGYGGIMTEAVYESERAHNFCCRGRQLPDGGSLYRDIAFLLTHQSYAERVRWSVCARVQKEYTPQRMASDARAAYCAARRIGIVGYYGFGNFGDEMMRAALERQLTERGFKDHKALCRAHPLRTLLQLRKCDTVLFGGGNLLQDETSLRSLLYYAVLLFAAKRDTAIGVSMGLGGFRTPLAERIGAWALGRLSRVYLRTEGDLAAAARLSPQMRARLHLSADLCFSYPEVSGKEQRGRKIAVFPTERCEEVLLPFLMRMRREGWETVFCVLFPRQDEGAAIRLAKRVGGAQTVRVERAEDFYACVRDAALAVSMRLHGAIFSLLMHTPCLLSAHSEKNLALLQDARAAANAVGSPCPLLPFRDSTEAEERKKEAAGKTYGFSEIIAFFRDRLNY